MVRNDSTISMLGTLLLVTSLLVTNTAYAQAQSPPVAAFTYTPDTPLVNGTVVFDASASYDPDGTIVSYTWNFGDGSSIVTTPEPIIDHTYRAEGNYTVTLTVTDDDGLSDTESKSLTIVNYPVARFSYSSAHPTISETVTFNASESTPDGGTIVNYAWDFGDDTKLNVTDPITAHAYTAEGNYTVTLTVTDSVGLADTCSKSLTVREYPSASFTYSPLHPVENETINFNGSDSTPDGGTIVSYAWSFGDETYGNGMIITHAYTTFGNFTVTLNITDSEGLSDTTSKPITVRGYPVANFTYYPAYPIVGETVTFNASESNPNGGTLVKCVWDFGDSENGSGITVNHAYSKFGTYNVTLNITESEGLNATCSSLIRVLIAPIANFTYSPSTPIINETITFNASTSYDPDGTLVNYAWDFGDGNTTIVSNHIISHFYTNARNYNVTLTIIDDDGLTDGTSKIIVVYTFIPVHDVAVIEVKPSTDWVYQGHITNVSVVVANQGTGVETFNVTLYYNNASIGTKRVIYLTPGGNASLTFSWNTTGVDLAGYTLSATASTVQGETDTTDNTVVDGTISVLWVGDVNHDGYVNILDLYLVIISYGSKIGDPKYKFDCDLNTDGRIDIIDIYLTIQNYGHHM